MGWNLPYFRNIWPSLTTGTGDNLFGCEWISAYESVVIANEGTVKSSSESSSMLNLTWSTCLLRLVKSWQSYVVAIRLPLHTTTIPPEGRRSLLLNKLTLAELRQEKLERRQQDVKNWARLSLVAQCLTLRYCDNNKGIGIERINGTFDSTHKIFR